MVVTEIKHNVDLLANAIIVFTAKEYARHLHRVKTGGGNWEDVEQCDRLRKWFSSKGYKRLTTLDGKYLLAEIEAHPEVVLKLDPDAVKPRSRRRRETQREKAERERSR